MNVKITAGAAVLALGLPLGAWAQAVTATVTTSSPVGAAAVAPASPAVKAEVRKAISDFHARVIAAHVGGKFADFQAAAQQYLAPDFTCDVNAATHTFAEYMDNAKRGMAHPLTSETITTKTLTFAATDAKETGQTDEVGPYIDATGALGTKGASHQIDSLSNYYMHWLKTDTGWKVHYASITSGRILVDGKLYVPPKAPAQPRSKKSTSGYGGPTAAVPTMNPQLPTVLRPNKTVRPRRSRKY